MRRKRPFHPNRRDVEILDLVYTHRYMSVELLGALLCAPPAPGRQYGFTMAALRTRCQKLRQKGYLVWQFMADQPSGRGWHTERPAVYSTGPAAVNFLAERVGADKGQLKALLTKNVVTSFFLRHFLGVAKFRVCLELACRSTPSTTTGGATVEIGTWLQDGLQDRVRISTDDGEEVIPVVPDAVFSLIVRKPSGATTVSHFALEYDRGTMPLSAIVQKARGYIHYLSQNLQKRKYTYAGQSEGDPVLRAVSVPWEKIPAIHQQAIEWFGVPTFQVLFVARAAESDLGRIRGRLEPSRDRQHHMTRAIKQAVDTDGKKTLFLFCTEEIDYSLSNAYTMIDLIWHDANEVLGRRQRSHNT